MSPRARIQRKADPALPVPTTIPRLEGTDVGGRLWPHVLNHLETGVAVIDPGGRVVLANPVAEKLLGGPLDSRAEALPFPPTRLRPGDSENRKEREIVIFRAPEGRLLSASLSPLPWPGPGEERTGTIAMIEDVTDQVLIGAQRGRSQTLAAMGEMAAEIAHQMRTPLGGLELFASILGREVSGDPNLERLVEHILGGVKQVNHLITNYLTFARPPRLAKERIALDRLVDEALTAADRRLAEGGLTVERRYADPAPMVEADPQRMAQVFLGVILNAIEASPNGGRLVVEVSASGARARVTFKDTGSGVAAGDLDQIFSPFYTTKNQCLGLGLAVSHQIVDAHQGLIQVKSRPGRGAAVTLVLPTVSTGPPRAGKDRS